MKRTIRFLPLALAMLAGSQAYAKELTTIDAYLSAAPLPSAASPVSVAAARGSIGGVASVDPKRGVPTFFWASPQSHASVAATFATAGPERVARAYAEQNAGLYGLSRAALSTVFVKHVHDTGRGGIIVQLGQRVDGIEVFQTRMNVLMDRQGALVAIGGNLHADATPGASAPNRQFKVPAAKAVASAFGDMVDVAIAPSDLVDTKRETDNYRYFDLKPTAATKAQKIAFNNAARVKKIFYAMPDRLVPAYYLELDVRREGTHSSDAFAYVISAATGETLARKNLMHDASFNYKVWADATAPYAPLDGPHEEFTPHPAGIPNGKNPAFIPPTMISMEGFNTNPNGMADPWLAANATQSTGNNVDAYADLVAPDGYNNGDVRATTTSANTFDRTYDVLAAPDVSNAQIRASITQLFYDINWLHDYYYDSGFNEPAGNGQTSNFGRGGAQGDPVLAQAQDYSGMNNANMFTPADGQSPRMQMYLWDGPSQTTFDVAPIGLSAASKAAAFGPNAFNFMDTLVLGQDGAMVTANNVDIYDGCQNFINNVAGQIVLVNRGDCTFESKAQRAQQAGAVGIIIANNTAPGLPPMGEDPMSNANIPALGISQADGDLLKQELGKGPLTATMIRIPSVDRDGTIDNGIVAHEWGHYFHHRLSDCGAAQCDGHSEGWGDFIALMLAIDEGEDVANGTFAAAIYSTAVDGDSGYFGIRRFPYSRDMMKNGLTFKHVTDGVALPMTPIQPNGIENWEVHNAGEVWSQMLFQAYTELLLNGGHAFTEAKRRMADYIVGGLKMAPGNPTTTEQRDGILAAAAAADINDFLLLAQGFAARGVGSCAVSPDTNSADGSGVVEDFTLSGVPSLASLKLDDSIVTCDGDGVLDAEETGKLTIEVFNSGAGMLTNAQITVSTAQAGVSFPSGTTASLASVSAQGVGTATVDVALDNSVVTIADLAFEVTITSNSACVSDVQATLPVTVNYNETQQDTATETVESPNAPWTKWSAPGFTGLAGTVWTRSSQANGNHRWYGQDVPYHSDTAIETPDLVVDANQAFVISFDHAFDFEASQEMGQWVYWDGGLIEISKDNGQSWEDISTYVNPGYNGQIAQVAGADNPLGSRNGYVRRNAAWPNTNAVTLDLGNALAGSTVKVRFRVGTDALEGVPNYQGWFVDNINFQGITNTPFHTTTLDPAGCNKAPLAVAGPDITVKEGDMVTLNASMSSDPDSDPLMFGWSQSTGPNVALSDSTVPMPTFTAPQVAADTTLTFEVLVDDGVLTATDTIDVLVLDVPMGSGGAGGGGGNGTGGMGTGGMGNGGDGTGGMGAGGEGTGGSGGRGGSGLPDPGTEGGCDCEAAGASSAPTGSSFASLLAAALLYFRRRRGARSVS